MAIFSYVFLKNLSDLHFILGKENIWQAIVLSPLYGQNMGHALTGLRVRSLQFCLSRPVSKDSGVILQWRRSSADQSNFD